MLALGVSLAAVIPLSIHAVMLDDLHVPYPANLPRSGWPVLSRWLFLVVGAMAVDSLLARSHAGWSVARRWLVLFLLVAGLREELIRDEFMKLINMTHVTIYPVLRVLPMLLLLAFAAIATGAARTSLAARHARSPAAINAFAAIVVATLIVFAIKPLLDQGSAAMLARLSSTDSPSRWDPPYDWHILIPAYVTFLEPVAASFALGLLTWPALPVRRVTRVVWLAALIALIKGPLLEPLVNIVFANTDPVTAMLSAGQFTFETIALALLTAATLELTYVCRIRST